MNVMKWKQSCAALSLGGVLCFPIATIADDDKPAKEPKSEAKTEIKAEVKVVTLGAPGKHWIGVHAMPIRDEALLSQLNLKDRLIVVHVVPDSPAAKGGIQTHDILLKLGDTELKSIDDLIKSVKDNGDKVVNVLVLRGGKETRVEVKPGDRPADAKIQEHALHVVPEQLRLLVGDNYKFQLGEGKEAVIRVIGPGIASGAQAHAHALTVTGGTSIPNGMSISISKENDQPAKIVVKNDGKTYETTEDKLDVLPKEIRGHVERMVKGGPRGAIFHMDPEAIKSGVPAEAIKKAVDALKKHAEGQQGKAEGDGKSFPLRTEVRKTEGGAVDELRKEVEALRKEVKKLQSASRDDDDKDK